MNILSGIIIVLAVLLASYATLQLVYFKRFAKESLPTVGTVIGEVPVKRRKGSLPLVRFKAGTRTVTAKALVFEQNAAIHMGEKVTIRYLKTGEKADSWDVRLIGKNGIGKKRTMFVCAVEYGIAAALAVAAILTALVLLPA